MSDQSPAANIFTGFVIGAAVGAVVALLFAPRPGREVRALVKEKLLDVEDRALDIVDRTAEMAQAAAVEEMRQLRFLREKMQAAAAEARKAADAKAAAIPEA